MDKMRVLSIRGLMAVAVVDVVVVGGGWWVG